MWPLQQHPYLLGLAIGAQQFQPLTSATGLTTMYTHKVERRKSGFRRHRRKSFFGASARSLTKQKHPDRDHLPKHYLLLQPYCSDSQAAQITSFFCTGQKQILVVLLLQAKKTPDEKSLKMTPKSEAPGRGFQNRKKRHHFLAPIFCRFWCVKIPSKYQRTLHLGGKIL